MERDEVEEGRRELDRCRIQVMERDDVEGGRRELDR